MKPNPARRRHASHRRLCAHALPLFLSCVLTRTASAVTDYWDGTGTTWNSVADWSTSSSATTPNPIAVPGPNDIATFDITTVSSPQTVTLDANQSVSGIVFNSIGGVTINSGSGANTLTLGTQGFIVNTSAAIVETVNSAIALSAPQTWTNNAINAFFVVNGNVTNGVNQLTVGGIGTSEINGNIGGGSGSLVKSGTGAVLLAGTDTYTGATTVNAGTLDIGSAGALGTTSGVSIASGATLNLVGQSISSVPIAVVGTGVSGSGALYNASGVTVTISSTINGSASASFTVGGSGAMILSGAVGSVNVASSIVKVGNGTLTLSGASDNFGMGLTVNGGTVILAKTSTATAHAVGGAGITINTGGTVQLAGTGGDEIYDGAAVTVNAGGVFDVNGQTETFGTLNLGGTGINGDGSLLNTSPLAGAVLSPSNTVLTSNTTVDVTTVGSAGAGSLTLNNTVSGNFSLTKIGAGVLILNGNNTFTGGVIVGTGTITMGNAGALNATMPNALTFGGSGAVLNLNGFNLTVSSLNGSAGFLQNQNLSEALLTVNATSNSTYGGVLRDGNGIGPLSVTKTGTGTLTLSGTNTFSGNLVINGGTLQLAGSTALGDGTVVLNSAGTLDLAGQTVGSTTMNAEAGTLINSSATPAALAASITNGVLNFSGSGDVNLSGSINGSIVNSNSSANLTLSGTTDNSYLGLNVTAGTVLLAKTSMPGVHAVGGSGMNISGGLVQLSGTGYDQIADNAPVTITGGSFDTNGLSETFNNLNLQGFGLNNNGAILNSVPYSSALTIPGGAVLTGNAAIGVTQSFGSLTLNADISGSFSLTKLGQGILTLTGNNTFTGNLIVSNGTLAMNGGSFSSNLTNNATFAYYAGAFNGRLINAGAVSFFADFTAGNGIENDAAMYIPAGQIISISGAGLNNQAALTLNGTIALTTLPAITNTNQGTLTLQGGILNGSTFFNGIFLLNSGFLTNTAAGVITGFGTINAPLTNNGTISPAGGTLSVPAFINNGDVEMTSAIAPLAGGAVTNNAVIEGFGKIANAVTNNASIEATGGNLVFTGNVTNASTATLRTATGTKILMLGATTFTTNAGLIDLAGGTFDNGGQPLINNGSIVGYGVLSTGGGGLTNNNILTFTGGTSTINGPVTNAAGKTLNIKYQPALFTGNITNNGTIKTTSTTVTFTGNYTGNTYTSDPATNIFQANATTIAGGLMTGSTGDAFVFNTFTNNGTFQNGGNLSVSTSITNAGAFTQSGPQSWSSFATFTNTAGTASFQSNTKLANLTITGGTVDTTTSQLIIESTNKPATLAALESDIAAHSLLSSTLPAHLGLAIIDNATLATPFTTFGGMPADSNSILIAPELLGDANLDGKVDLNDLNTILNNLGTNQSTWTKGNFDGATTIDLTDLNDVLNQLGASIPNLSTSALSAQSSAPSSPAPEPASLALLIAGPIAFLCQRRQHRSQAV